MASLVPDFLRQGQAGQLGRAQGAVRFEPQEAQDHHQLAHVLGGVPGAALEDLDERLIAVVGRDRGGKIGLSGALPPGLEPVPHDLAVGRDVGAPGHAVRRWRGQAFDRQHGAGSHLQKGLDDDEDVMAELQVRAVALRQLVGDAPIRDLCVIGMARSTLKTASRTAAVRAVGFEDDRTINVM